MGESFRSYTVYFPDLGKPVCRFCGCQHGWVKPTKTKHFAEIICANGDCAKHLGWMPKPKGSNKKRVDTKGLVKRYSPGYCQMCLRREYELPRSEALEAHLVLPKSEGGNEDQSNIWIVCSKCHSLIHHERTYLGHYKSQDSIEHSKVA